MKNYSVLLVDDEENVIQSIIRTIAWEELGFTVQGYAHNGVEALEMAEETQPDVVMTDIKMPYMDGLALSRRLKEEFPAIKIIIFSGFDEFEYAKEAIRLEAEEYILKPIDAGELTELFKRIHAALDQEFDEKQNINMLKNYYLESLPILQENFYTSLIEGNIRESDVNKEMMDYQVSLDGPYYAVVLLHNSICLAPEGINPLLITMSVRKLWEERLDSGWNTRYFNYLGNIVLIVQMSDPARSVQLTDACEVLCRLSKHVSNAVITAGVGHVVDSIMDLGKSYDSAREAIDYRVIYGRGKAINIAEIAPGENAGRSYVSHDEAMYNVFKAIKMDGPEEVKREVEAYFSKNAPENPMIQEYHFFLMDMISELHRFLDQNQIGMDRIFEKEQDLYRELQQKDMQELKRWMLDATLRIQEHVKSSRSDSTRSFVSKAIDYVHEHYGSQDLNVESICAYLGVSAAYFSTVFKRETGKTFINFLTDYRMEKAVRMLLGENEKTYVIAEAVGYSDPNYFSYAFKKKFGMSPSKYKAQQNG